MATNPNSLLKAEVVDHLRPIVSMFHSARPHIEKSEPSDRSRNQDWARYRYKQLNRKGKPDLVFSSN